MPDRIRRWLWLILVGIFLIAMSVRVIAALRVGYPDIIGYAESGVIAKNMVQGRGFTFDFYGTRPNTPLRSFMPPLFPALIALCLRFSDHPAMALYLSQSFLSSLTAVCIYFLGARLSSSWLVGLLAAIGVALYPILVIMSVYPITVTLNLFALTLFLLSSLLLREKMTPLLAVLTGVALGILVLLRPSSLGMLLVLTFWLWLNVPRNPVNLLKVVVIVLAFTLITVLPWTLRNYQVQGRFVFVSTNGGFTLWQGANPFSTGSGFEVDAERLARFRGMPVDPQGPKSIHLMPYQLPREIEPRLASIHEVDLDRELFQAGLKFVQEDPGRFVELLWLKLKAFWWFRTEVGGMNYEESWIKYYKLLYIAVLCVFLPGIILSVRWWRSYALLYLLFLYYTLTYVAFNAQTRYRWDIEPYFLIFAALTAVYLWETALSWWEQRSNTPQS